MKEVITILCVDDEPNVLSSMRRMFLDEEYELLTALSGKEGLELLAGVDTVQVVVADYRMPRMNGVDFLKEVSSRWPDTVRLVLSGYADIAAVVSAINEGKIYKFIPKPWNDEELKLAVAQAIDIYYLQQEHRELVKKLTRHKESHELLMHEKTQALRAKELELREMHAILDSLPGGVLVLDNDKMIVHCNRACLELLKTSSTPLPGQGADHVLPPQILAYIDNSGQEYPNGHFHFSGRDLEVKVSAMPPVRETKGTLKIVEFWERR